ncbi:prokineticin-2-like [Panulirus ornatus]|uniref:prokineticin-2-like n=1 Tax=Panulirus ornatus TaxID=150431 RepID=UPI003A8403DB
MFRPTAGDQCSDNIDCASGCCLMTGHRHRRPIGVCQPLQQMGEYCAPGNRLRNYYGSRVYTYSCPCGAGLSCKPTWSSMLYGRSVMEDPKCMPETMHPYVLAMKGYGYNTYNRHTNFINIVPAE